MQIAVLGPTRNSFETHKLRNADLHKPLGHFVFSCGFMAIEPMSHTDTYGRSAAKITRYFYLSGIR